MIYNSLTCKDLLISFLTLMLPVANLENTNWCKKGEKMTETLANGYSSESTQRVQYLLKIAFVWEISPI